MKMIRNYRFSQEKNFTFIKTLHRELFKSLFALLTPMFVKREKNVNTKKKFAY
jgi:hypothetical protein